MKCNFPTTVLLGLGVSLFGAVNSTQASGTWTPITNYPPAGHWLEFPLLLNDGRVMCGEGTNNWYILTPDIHGSYANGTWSTLAQAEDTRLYNSSQLLLDGRVYQAGGEYGTGRNTAEVYDPATNVWKHTSPNNMPSTGFSDAESKMVPGGNILQSDGQAGAGIYNAVTDTWSFGQQSPHNMNEMTWLTLPDHTILTCWDWSDRYNPATNTWILDTTSPVLLADGAAEIGPAFMLPNGKAFFIGGRSVTATYTPTGNTNPGSWTSGTIPNNLSCPDSPGVEMPNGKILCAMVDESGVYNSGNTSYAEYDYTTNSWAMVNGPRGQNHDDSYWSYDAFLMLPDGTVLFVPGKSTNDQSAGWYAAYIYTPDGTPITAGRPVISTISPNSDGSYHLAGTGLTGISAGASYGDDKQMATNYPIVRLVASNGNVYYAKTFNWSNTGIQTGNTVITTEFSVPSNVPSGAYSLIVSASGLQSAPVTFNYGAVKNGTYTLTPLNATGSRLDVAAGGTANGSKCEIWQSNGGANQKWIFTKQADGSYEITPSYAGAMCLDANGTASGSLVSLWTYHNTSNEHWLLTSVAGGAYELVPESAPGNALDVNGAVATDGTQVVISSYHSGTNQQWLIGTN